MDDNIDFILECAIWANLDRVQELELTLLKGHLYLEATMEFLLNRNKISEYKNYSFYKKVLKLADISFSNKMHKSDIIASLHEINKLRNKLAHEFQFDVRNGELEKWAQAVLNKFTGTKFTKYTYKTKVVHAFSILALNLLSLNTSDSA